VGQTDDTGDKVFLRTDQRKSRFREKRPESILSAVMNQSPEEVNDPAVFSRCQLRHVHDGIDFDLDEPLGIDEPAHFHHAVDGADILEVLASYLRNTLPVFHAGE
jgi:hypothetical protein